MKLCEGSPFVYAASARFRFFFLSFTDCKIIFYLSNRLSRDIHMCKTFRLSTWPHLLNYLLSAWKFYYRLLKYVLLATVEFSECNNTSQHSYQLGLMCAKAHRNRDWCDEDEWVELDTTTPSKLPDVQLPVSMRSVQGSSGAFCGLSIKVTGSGMFPQSFSRLIN